MEKIVFEIGDLVLMEPMALVFNWIISIQCLLHFRSLKQSSSSGQWIKGWAAFFALFSASTFFGGISHTFYHYLGMNGKIPGWSLAVLSISCLEYTVLLRHSFWKPWIAFSTVLIQTILVFLVLSFDFQFLWVTIHTSMGLLLVLGGSSLILRTHNRGNIDFIIAIAWMLASLPFVILGIDLNTWFNRHDISHVFMIISLYKMYDAAKKSSTTVSKH